MIAKLVHFSLIEVYIISNKPVNVLLPCCRNEDSDGKRSAGHKQQVYPWREVAINL